MEREAVRSYVNRYCLLRDMQFAAYEFYARRHGLTAKELFVLDILWFAPEEGCPQSEIGERLSATKQTVSAILRKFWRLGYLTLTESAADRRSKVVRFTPAGREYAERIIPPAAGAEVDAMAELDAAGEDIARLVRLTTLFSEQMKAKFQALGEEQQNGSQNTPAGDVPDRLPPPAQHD